MTKQLGDGFKRSVHCSNCRTIPTKVVNQGANIYELLSASFQGVKRLFVLAYTIASNAADNEAGTKDNKKYFLLRREIKNYNVLIDGRKFNDKPINYLIKQYNEARKVSTGQGDYTTGCLLDYGYLKNNYRLTAVDLSIKKL